MKPSSTVRGEESTQRSSGTNASKTVRDEEALRPAQPGRRAVSNHLPQPSSSRAPPRPRVSRNRVPRGGIEWKRRQAGQGVAGVSRLVPCTLLSAPGRTDSRPPARPRRCGFEHTPQHAWRQSGCQDLEFPCAGTHRNPCLGKGAGTPCGARDHAPHSAAINGSSPSGRGMEPSVLAIASPGVHDTARCTAGP